MTAHQPGDSDFDAAEDVDQRFTIEKARQKIVGTVPELKTYLDPDFPLDLTATSGLPVVFIASGGCETNESYVRILAAGTCSLTAHQPGDAGACQVSGSILYIVGEGTCTVTAMQPGNGNFNAAPAVTQTLEVVGP